MKSGNKIKSDFLFVASSDDFQRIIPMKAIDTLMLLILQAEEDEVTPTPLISTQGGIHFLYL